MVVMSSGVGDLDIQVAGLLPHSLRAAAGLTAVCNLEISELSRSQAEALDRVCSLVSGQSVPAQTLKGKHVTSAAQLYVWSNKTSKNVPNPGMETLQSNSAQQFGS